MKKLVFLLTLMMAFSLSFAQSGTLSVTFKFVNIVDGYDHVSKTQVYVDGNMVGESKEVKESVGATFSVNVPTGTHDVRIVNLALYEGNWEEHTVANSYSIDCLWEGEYTFKAKNKFFMLCDIDDQTQTSWKKMPKAKKKK